MSEGKRTAMSSLRLELGCDTGRELTHSLLEFRLDITELVYLGSDINARPSKGSAGVLTI